MTKTSTQLFHAFALSYYLFVLYTITENNKKTLPEELTPENVDLIKTMRSFSPRYLTNWTFGIQAIYLWICLCGYLLDLIPGCRKLREKADKLSNFIGTSIATPMALIVTSVFWSFFIYDRELIFPKVIDLVMPLWINHSIHTVNAVVALLDIYFVDHKFPSFTNAAQGLLCYLVLYGGCLFGTYLQTGVWLYPFMGKLTWGMRVGFTVATFFVGLIMFFITKFMSRLIWGAKGTSTSKSQKKNQKQKSKNK